MSADTEQPDLVATAKRMADNLDQEVTLLSGILVKMLEHPNLQEEDPSLPSTDKVASSLSHLIRARDLARQNAGDPVLVTLNGALVRLSSTPPTSEETRDGVISFDEWRKRLRPVS